MTPQPEQPPLLPEAAGQPSKPARFYFLRQDAPGLFTGQEMKRLDPDRYALIVELLSDGALSQRQIAKSMKVSPSCLRAIAANEGLTIGTVRARLADRCAELEAATLDRIAEILEEPNNTLDLRELAVTLREIGNRSDVLSGRPSGIIEHRHDVGPAALAAAAAARRAKLDSIITTCDERTHSTDRKSEPHVGDAAGDPAGSGAIERQADDLGTDGLQRTNGGSDHA